MASSKGKDPKGPKDGDPTSTTSEKKGGDGNQDDPPRVSDEEDKVQAVPPTILDLHKNEEEQSKGNSNSTEHPDGISEVTGSSNSKRPSRYTDDQACRERIIRRLLDNPELKAAVEE